MDKVWWYPVATCFCFLGTVCVSTQRVCVLLWFPRATTPRATTSCGGFHTLQFLLTLPSPAIKGSSIFTDSGVKKHRATYSTPLVKGESKLYVLGVLTTIMVYVTSFVAFQLQI
ncbi:unnamed protein product [Ectocarpus sp. 12 AP-2014]